MGSGTTPASGRRLSMDDLAPSARAEVAVASFDDPTDEPADEGGGPAERTRSGPAAVADFGDLAPAAAPADGAPRDPGGQDSPAQDRAAQEPAGPRAPTLVEFGELAAPNRQPPAELGGLAAPVEGAPRLTMEDLRFGRSTRGRGSGREAPSRGRAGSSRSRRTSDDAPALDTESAAWEAGEFTAVGTDPERPTRERGRGRARSRRERPQEPVEDTRSPEEQEAAAKEMCLRLLTDRARSKHELGVKLKQKGVADEIAERVLERFDEVGLIDDEAFAGAWVRSRHRHRGLGRRAIAQELRRKGVDREVADEALTEVDDEAEALRARELVDRKLRTARVDGPDERRKVGQRLVGMLARKGYPSSIAYSVVRTALAEHGADEDELGPAADT
ncbi:RecX family transcriptional regulator [Pseudonocardia sp. WMMC193]|uniref:RecX family transcriptional regulator n=1 Tax=Pseudonocardia sp. WMMC193 TaxID=2911965 RepID=UPI0027DF7813|nr:RecX family transcriptional regulator [Pseudonocardia sp. WMMC193]